MKARSESLRKPGAPKSTAKHTSRASKPSKSPAKPKSPPKVSAKTRAKVAAGLAEPKSDPGAPASRLIDQRIRDLAGWRGETLARMRALILEADPEMT
jgi:hypothetical protein